MTVATPVVTARTLAISEIHVPEPYEALDITAKANLAGLTTAIIAHGMLEPVRVRRDGGRYVLVDGAKRIRACQDAGVVQVPVQIESD
jgi:ParB family transcriptional regulator, chromosome partitioning protein